ncbi:hypothetical protein PIB30_045981 [Stylosanthes scabra]|uniref:RRM domain-containing protein n=1 Tax=Stylosanthes scabra TaxID=79078 RepID=A0ABU6TG12_9FABA|nr:hypothetical protein [Stylosanthes scabra]
MEPRSNSPHTIFVDNLPPEVSKRALYKEFGKDGFFLDVFIARKERRNMNSPFAFIRYHAYGGALRAINRLNGTLWCDAKLFVTLSEYGREANGENRRHNTETLPIKREIWMPRRVEANKPGQHDYECVEPRKDPHPVVTDQKKEIEVVWTEEQNRDCREACWVFTCLLTFDSPEIKDEALNSSLLQMTFDEIKPH